MIAPAQGAEITETTVMECPTNRAPMPVWAVVLAAGEGTRLRSLTSDAAGRSTPKQYCSLFGGATLLEDALQRGASVTDATRVAAIVAAQHERHWRGTLAMLGAQNVVSQPENRGTAHGVLLATIAVLAREPNATLLFLPADHDVVDEARLAQAMHGAIGAVASEPQAIALVGIEPDEPDPELGYILPGASRASARAVTAFVEKPSREEAIPLLAAGALWNSFIFAVSGQTLLDLYRTLMPAVTARMAEAIASGDKTSLAQLYSTLGSVDFSRDLLAHASGRLRVVAARNCGWSDLGTPRRVSEAARRVRSPRSRQAPDPTAPSRTAMSLIAMLAPQHVSA